MSGGGPSMVPHSGLPLDTLASTIKARVAAGDRDAQKAEDHYKAAGIHLLELKQRVPVEAPGLNWVIWCVRATGLGPDRIGQLIRIGEGKTTQAELNAASNRGRSSVDTVCTRTVSPKTAPRTARREKDFSRRRAQRREANIARGVETQTRRSPEHSAQLKHAIELLKGMSLGDLQRTIECSERVKHGAWGSDPPHAAHS